MYYSNNYFVLCDNFYVGKITRKVRVAIDVQIEKHTRTCVNRSLLGPTVQ